MGLDFAYVVVVPPERAADLLRHVAAASRDGLGETTTVLVGGERIDLPCTSGYVSGRTLVVDDSPRRHPDFWLDLSLRFPVDDMVADYLADSPRADGHVGLIYAGLSAADWCKRGHLAFSFTAATTRMSVLFRDSAAIRGWFADLAIRSGAAVCLLDVEEERDWLVMANGTPTFTQLSWSHNYLGYHGLAAGDPLPGLVL
ncbi:hypothetical protein ACFQZ4_48500 [Catellatospora coxensis]|uniref:Uncharacterized protein n=1 Tax=Catellatospora coxensis TaxID=310354 RepID=A0A8J3KRZ7_9ACTN|nr:hypothetical protein [Catellatospora coxensis]GIG03929.1 hypothetical protein Cco03nite_06290 [Catellatospora coxensis]